MLIHVDCKKNSHFANLGFLGKTWVSNNSSNLLRGPVKFGPIQFFMEINMHTLHDASRMKERPPDPPLNKWAPFEPRKNPSYFPLNPGWLIGILITVYCNPYITQVV